MINSFRYIILITDHMLISGIDIINIEGNKNDMICKYNVVYMYIKLFLHYHTLNC